MQQYRYPPQENTQSKSLQSSTQQMSHLNPYSHPYITRPYQPYTTRTMHDPQTPIYMPPLGRQKPASYSTHNSVAHDNIKLSANKPNFNSHAGYLSPPTLAQNISPQYQPLKPSVFTSNIDIDTVVKSMNASSLRQMSRGQNIKHQDMMKLLAGTVEQMNRFSMMAVSKTQSLKHYFRIVELNESLLFDSSVSSSLKACSLMNSPMQKYQLLITLDGKQIKFQSMQNRNLHYNINLDTVKCEFVESEKITSSMHKIKFMCGQKTIEMLVNQGSLPYHLADDSNSEQAIEYIERSAKQITKFLKKSIEKSRGAQFKLMTLVDKDSEFYIRNYATEEQFAQYCQTGDILLFKDTHTFAKIQRVITNSEYDHIAFVFRSEKYGVCLIESSSGFGVSLTLWTHLVRKNWFRGIDSISWRRLLIHNKPKDYEQRVDAFITDNKNKKYGISFKKLLTFDRNQEKSGERDRTYFCSELVAELYKVLGLLDPKVSSTQYWPKHFSEKGYIAMLQNSALDKERVLVFEEEILKENYRGYKAS